MKLGEIIVHMDNYNFTKFYQNQMKNKKVLLIACFLGSNHTRTVRRRTSALCGKNAEGHDA